MTLKKISLSSLISLLIVLLFGCAQQQPSKGVQDYITWQRAFLELQAAEVSGLPDDQLFKTLFDCPKDLTYEACRARYMEISRQVSNRESSENRRLSPAEVRAIEVSVATSQQNGSDLLVR